MKKLGLILLGGVLAGLGLFFTVVPRYVDAHLNRVEPPPPPQVSEEARTLHERLFVADLHSDALLWGRDLLARHDRGHVDVPRLVEGNVALQTFAVTTKSPWGQNYERTEADSDRITLLAIAQRWPPRTWASLKARALFQARKLREAAARSGGQLVLIRSVHDLDRFEERRRKEPSALAALLAVEGLHALEGDPRNVDVFYEAGYRMMALTHLFDNTLGGSSTGASRGGLTARGRQVVRRMEKQGIVVDLAHASERVVLDVLDEVTRPVVVSHTGVRATCDTRRNLSDLLIRRIARNGGVIGIGFWDTVLCGNEPADIARAVRHVADLVGVDHVALGSDFDGTVRVPFDAAGLVQVTDALLEAGFTENEIYKIMGGNVLRVLRKVLRPNRLPATGSARLRPTDPNERSRSGAHRSEVSRSNANVPKR